MKAEKVLKAMFNVMLDRLPEEWNGHKIRTDFRIGIQIIQCLGDMDFTMEERLDRAFRLLFLELPDSYQDAREGLSWFMTEFCHDNYSAVKHENVVLMDYDIDQWRIYSAFLLQYHIDLNKTKMHWFVFMGLLNNLEECTYTRIIEIRRKKIDAKLPIDTKKILYDAKKIYGLDKRQPEESEEDKEAEKMALAAFNMLRNGR